MYKLTNKQLCMSVLVRETALLSRSGVKQQQQNINDLNSVMIVAIIKGMTVKLIYVHWNETLGTSTIDDQNNSGQINSSSTSE